MITIYDNADGDDDGYNKLSFEYVIIIENAQRRWKKSYR